MVGQADQWAADRSPGRRETIAGGLLLENELEDAVLHPDQPEPQCLGSPLKKNHIK